MATKPPGPQRISALLRKAGHEKSVSSAGTTEGLRNRSEGHVVAVWIDEGAVSVRHVTGSFWPLASELERVARRLAEYATAIEAAGFAVERRDDRLIVTSKPAQTEED